MFAMSEIEIFRKIVRKLKSNYVICFDSDFLSTKKLPWSSIEHIWWGCCSKDKAAVLLYQLHGSFFLSEARNQNMFFIICESQSWVGEKTN